MAERDCEHPNVDRHIRWDFAPNSIIVSCATCGAEAVVPVDWDDREWGEG